MYKKLKILRDCEQMKKGISKTVLKMITTRNCKCDIGTPVSDAILELLKKKQVTIGFRESCGCTDSTAKEKDSKLKMATLNRTLFI